MAEWFDPEVTRRGRGFAFSAPLIPGAADAGRAFATKAFRDRGNEFAAARRDLGQSGEVITLVSTPEGDVTALCIEGEDPVDANRRFAASTAAFDVWFKDELKKLYPPFIDFYQPAPGIEEIFDSEAVLARR